MRIATMKQAIPLSYIVAAPVLIAGAWLWATGALELDTKKGEAGNTAAIAGETQDLENQVLPPEGIVLPIRWGSLGMQMMETGVVDEAKLNALYQDRGGLPEDMQKLLYSSDNQEVRMTYENSGVLLNLLWGFGLGNKNSILETGPMMDPRFNGAGNFASTGGWTLATGGAMDHYSKYAFIALTPEQQALVERVSKNIYRPCCGNSTYFPDCNHGMAMLGLLELMAANGVREDEMYRVALQVNSYWFPDTYLTIATYFAKQGVSWDAVSPKEALGNQYSSGSGYQRVRALVEPVKQQGGGSCGL
ncbi:MAG: hypothetical protein A3C82_02085 [Candidatus Wildermuthbacteria bacterium RIFCSPHIGHO2_02_FULL_47_12]|uniref:Uncharacterized protein n=1 Tax=Candidatus Wildermuthbacteria bacterium RIFCSPHIGHO2_02_FULL_47_12 TaxID=1802451 RepID=A0A1G2R312_9BACT|nr:MAG: hypothetical protein A3C82_02085 [Candidatus Wildermuthbacteria bacterium RIFCSPHIGHO2_02_FULL_47_12]